MHEKASNKIK